MRTDLTHFLLGRIAEDETEARIAREIPWDWSAQGKGSAAAHFVSHMSPLRLDVECEAKRRIITNLTALAARDSSDRWNLIDSALMDTLRDLAAPYADHPDYRDEWKF